MDGVSKEQYGQALEANLEDLHKRLKAKRYRHQPLRRVHIPKGGGRTRPIGISAVEDKVVQGALREVLEAVYEQDFLECSYGFRPGRSAHDAIRALNRAVYQGKVSWILEADIESFFDSLDRTRLEEMLRIRVADGSLRRLVGKCVRVGVLDGGETVEPERGTPQGSGLSQLLGNLYLHYQGDAAEPAQYITLKATPSVIPGFKRRAQLKRLPPEDVLLHRRLEIAGDPLAEPPNCLSGRPAVYPFVPSLGKGGCPSNSAVNAAEKVTFGDREWRQAAVWSAVEAAPPSSSCCAEHTFLRVNVLPVWRSANGRLS